jgi:Flp pilus assembly protein TadD
MVKTLTGPPPPGGNNMEERWTKRQWGKTRSNYWPKLVAGPAAALIVLAVLLMFVGRNTTPASGDIDVRKMTPPAGAERAQVKPVSEKPAIRKHRPEKEAATVEETTSSPFEISLRAQKSYMKGDFEDAADALRVLVTLDTDNYYWRYLLGLCYGKLGDHGKAISELLAAKSLNQDSWKVRANLARAALDAHEFERALPWAQEAIELDRNSESLNVLGLVWMERGNRLGAENAFAEAIELDPTNAYPLNNLGLVLLRSGKFAQAIPYLEKAADLRPDLAFVHNNLGICYEREGKVAMARDEFKVAVSCRQDYSRAKTNLERVEATLDEDEELIAASAAAQ